ncbi:polyketide synthase [Thioploca ingrica]|uniref:Polyketide synthase n=1 Tax=Thioploca ingrica TaxID=40754 RepID=A0A090AMK6_9GAMM|nr:polyketide synthase [Thioploca ingrica]
MDTRTKQMKIEQLFLQDDLKQTDSSSQPNVIQETVRSFNKEPIAIIGVSGFFPQCMSVREFWDVLDQDLSLIDEIPASRFNWKDHYDSTGTDPTKMRSKWGGFIPDIETFDAQFFKILPSEAEQLDPRQRLLLMSCYHSIEDAGYAPFSWKGSQTGVFIGVESNEYLQNLVEWNFPQDIGFSNVESMVANRISYLFDFKGPSEIVNTLCSGAAVALHRAVVSLRLGEVKQAIVGGANLILRPEPFVALSNARQISTTNSVNSFGKDPQGYLRSEGVITVVLKPLSQAETDGDAIYALIKNTAVNYNGQGGMSIAAPNVDAHSNLIQNCYQEVGTDPRQVEYIEAQGMGIELTDTVEWQAFNQALQHLAQAQDIRLATGQTRVSTLKPMLGHMHAASALGALLKIIWSFQTNKIYKILNITEINPHLSFQDQPCQLATETNEWSSPKGCRLAGLHSYGFSGNNAHILIEEYKAPVKKSNTQPDPVIIPISAETPEQVHTIVRNLLQHIQKHSEMDFSVFAHTLQHGRDVMASKVAFVATNMMHWSQQATAFLEGRIQQGVFTQDTTWDGDLMSQHAVAQSWCQGKSVTWETTPSYGWSARYHLPGYPFDRQRYWISKPIEPINPTTELGTEPVIEPASLSPKSVINDQRNSGDLFQQAERIIRNILSDFLKIPEGNIDLHAELSDLGFDSIWVLKLSSKLKEQYAISIDPISLFECTTPNAFIDYLCRVFPEKFCSTESIQERRSVFNTQSSVVDAKKKRIEAEPSNNAPNLNEAIAIIGLAGRYPKSKDLEAFWNNLQNGTDCIEEIPADHWDLKTHYHPDRETAIRTGKSYSKWGGFLSGLYEFDPLFFNISPHEAEQISPKERLFLQCAWHALEEAGYTPESLKNDTVGVFVGVTKAGYDAYPGTFGSIANRVSYFCDFHGPSMPVDTMCSASLVAIHEACQHIRFRDCDLALAGGVNAYIHPSHFNILAAGEFLSPDGRCHSFGKDANGMVAGEGVGAVLLKPLSKAIQDHDHIWGVIRSTAINHGGKTNGFTVPNPKSQQELIQLALKRSGINARHISYVEAHGTGTVLGDPIEVRGLTEAFQNDTEETQYCSLGSVKSNIGHLEAAAGISALTKILLQMKHQSLVPSLHSTELNPKINFSLTPFHVQQTQEPWNPTDQNGDTLPRVAGVSSFGAGGSNAHAIIEEYAPKPQTTVCSDNSDNTSFIIVLSAKNADRLNQQVKQLLIFIDQNADKPFSPYPLRDLAYTLQVGRKAFDERLALVVQSFQDIRKGLEGYINQKNPLPNLVAGQHKKYQQVFSHFTNDEDMRKIIEVWVTKKKYLKVAEAWAYGFTVDWSLLYTDSPPYRVSLPVYPFSTREYRIDDPNYLSDSVQSNINPQPDQSVGTFMVTPVWKESSISSAPLSDSQTKFSERWVVSCELKAFDSEVMQSNIPNSHCSILESNTIDLDSRFTDYTIGCFKLLRRILETKPTGPVLIQLLIPNTPEQSMFAGVLGLFKTAELENPKLFAQILQVDSQVTTKQLIECVQENVVRESHIKYEGDKRWVKGWQEQAEVIPTETVFKGSGIYLITGGLGGLGILFAKEILKQTQNTTLILTGRSALTAQKQTVLDSLRRLAETNPERVQYRSVDVANSEQVNELIQSIQQDYGKLNGILHSAGILKDNFILKKTTDEFEKVLAPKVAGTIQLDKATAQLDLDFFVLFSSVAAALGNVGQADYAAANAFMDLFAEYRNHLLKHHKRYGKTLSINWPLWKEGSMGIDAAQQAHLEETTGIYPMQTDTGIQFLYQSLGTDVSQHMVLEGVTQKIKKCFFATQLGTSAQSSTASVVDPTVFRKKTLTNIIDLFSKVIKLPAVEIDEHEDFQSYGIDSILINQLNQQLETVFGNISKTLFFEYENLDYLTEYLLRDYPSQCLTWTGLEKTPPNTQFPYIEPTTSTRTVVVEPVPDLQTGLADPLPSQQCRRNTDIDAKGIAIIGLSGVYPQAGNLEQFWQNLKNGQDCITEIPADRWSLEGFYQADADTALQQGLSYSKWGGFVESFAEFDPLFFNISPKESMSIDPQERLFLQTAWKALEDAGYTRTMLKETYQQKVGVFAGITKTGFDLYGLKLWQEGRKYFPHTSFSSVANRLSFFLNVRGPSMPIDTMCSSSLTAIHEACEHIYRGDCELALAGGVNLYLHPANYIAMCAKQMLSKDGQCKSFGIGGNGFVPGEGAGVVLLKSLASAIRDQDAIHAVIRATQVNHGGKTNGYTVPNPGAQTELIRSALDKAGVNARHISYIEAHGTGTELGDPIEITGLTHAFQHDTQDVGFCKIGSAKSNLGHLEAAAGIAGLTKTILQMKHGKIVPSLHAKTVNPNISFEKTPFVVNQELTSWPRPQLDGTEIPRLAGISSFGAGGANAHVILEEYQDHNLAPEKVTSDKPTAASVIIPLSAQTQAQLDQRVAELLAWLKSDSVNLHSLAYTLQLGREAMEYRLGVVVSSIQELRNRLTDYLSKKQTTERLYIGNSHQLSEATAPFKSEENQQQTIKKWLEQPELEPLLKLWVKGVTVDWGQFYTTTTPQRLHLPTYPFSQKRYWIKDEPEQPKRTDDSPPASMPKNESLLYAESQPLATIDQTDSASLRRLRVPDEIPPFNLSENSEKPSRIPLTPLVTASVTESGRHAAPCQVNDVLKPVDVLEDLKSAIPTEIAGLVPTLNRTGVMLEQLTPCSKSFVEFAGPCGGWVLDIGCAYGVATIAALEKGAHVFAVDMEQQHLDILSERVNEKTRPQLVTEQGMLPDVDFEKHSFAAIHASRVIHFLSPEDVQKTIRKMADWLQPGGKLFLISDTPYTGYWKSKASEYERRKAAGDSWPSYIDNVYQVFNPQETMGGPPRINPLDPDTLRRECEYVGLEVEYAGFEGVDSDLNTPESKQHNMEQAAVIAIKPLTEIR